MLKLHSKRKNRGRERQETKGQRVSVLLHSVSTPSSDPAQPAHPLGFLTAGTCSLSHRFLPTRTPWALRTGFLYSVSVGLEGNCISKATPLLPPSKNPQLAWKEKNAQLRGKKRQFSVRKFLIWEYRELLREDRVAFGWEE